MDLGLKGRRALVTGASSGLGKGWAAALAAEGARVFICARGEERLAAAAAELAAQGWLAADLALREDIERLVEAATGSLGGLDILVTNTPNPEAGPFAAKTES